jgi:hypothetical protein
MIRFENVMERDSLKDLGEDGRIKTEWILEKQRGVMWTGCVWLRAGANGG